MALTLTQVVAIWVIGIVMAALGLKNRKEW